MEDRTLVTRVILVRHGQSTYNAQSRIQGRSDHSSLTEEGVQMAHLAGEALKGIHFDAVYTSPLQRAHSTAATIVSHLAAPAPLHPEPTLMEINLPLWEGLTRAEVKAQYAEAYRLWQEHPDDFFMDVPDAETTQRIYPVRDLYEQAGEFWQKIIPQHQGKTILVVAHNGILRSLLSVALGIRPDHYTVVRQSNCGISVLNFSGLLGDGVQLESLNLTDPVGEKLPDRRDRSGVRLLLVRHGETQWNREQRFQGQIDVPLNDNGLAQADKVAQFLQDVPLDFAITSPLLRPKQTAEAIVAHHPGVELTDEPGLKEIGHGLWEGKLESEIVAEYGDLLADWKAHPETVQMPEGENLQQVWDRSVAAWEKIVETAPAGSTGLVVAHDAVNKVILCSVLGLAPKDIWAIKQGNGGVTIVDYSGKPNSKPVLQAMNITTHFGGGVLDQTAAGAL
ncbi:MAG: histidine phosphatase family protein [Prochlorotrichaceae cyanobacterium]